MSFKHRLKFVLLAAAVVGCAPATTRLYEGPARPDHEVAVIAEAPGTRAGVYAIDDQRAAGKSWAVLPGLHVVWVDFQVLPHGGDRTRTIWSYCRIEFVAAPGGAYRVESFAMPESEEGPRSEAVGARIVDAQGALMGLAQSCSLERPRFR